MDLLDSQPEFTRAIWEYLDILVTDARIADGRAILARYPFIRHWEFWNEPELWTRLGRDVGDYLPWLARFYAVAKEVDPTIQVAAGTLAGWEYLGWLYDVSDATLGTRPWDAVAFHPYNTREEVDEQGAILPIRTREIERLRTQMVARGDERKPIWITEMGWTTESTSDAYGYGDWITEELQAQYLVRAFEIAQTEWPWVDNILIWHLNTAAYSGPEDPFSGFSVTDAGGFPRPSYHAISNLLQRWEAQFGAGQ